MNRQERREVRSIKIKKRERLLEKLGLQYGSIYEKHRKKIRKSKGYMAKHGTFLHYAQRRKRSVNVREKNSYNGTNNWSHRDRKQIDDGLEQLREYINK